MAFLTALEVGGDETRVRAVRTGGGGRRTEARAGGGKHGIPTVPDGQLCARFQVT